MRTRPAPRPTLAEQWIDRYTPQAAGPGRTDAQRGRGTATQRRAERRRAKQARRRNRA
jgi:hypothetical protein